MALHDEVSLLQALIRAPSPSGREAAAADVYLSALVALGFDCSRDPAGNVIGVLERGEGPTVMLNGHLDTVATGEPEAWPHPPLAGEVAQGRVWGRGAVDMKGALACMALAGRDAADDGFSGTLVIAGVVQEEVGGLGARYLAEHLRADVVVVGEPSSLRLMLGHRGRVEVEATFPGKIAHAARNELGENALYYAADFLQRLRELELPAGGPLGGSSVTPTRLATFPESVNVVPGRAVLTLDYRTIPGDEAKAILARLAALAPEASFVVPLEDARSESGEVRMQFPRIAPAYAVPAGDPWVERAREALGEVFSGHGTALEEGYWWFATDAPYLAKSGATVVGFGPGDEELAHTTRESVCVRELALAREGYAALVRRFMEGEGDAA
jgi:putative selenium metabolism hydrolase